jgi:hypothetical protein
MDNTLKPVLKRQLLFIGASLGIYLVVSYFFGFFVAFIVNTALFIGIILYIRKRQNDALRPFGFGDSSNTNTSSSSSSSSSRYPTESSTKLKYSCLSCGAEVKGSKCKRCGSKMKKPVF